MYATDADTLLAMIRRNPDTPPSTFLRDDSLAARLYDRWSVRELKSAFERDADPDLCDRYQLSAGRYKEEIAMALIARKAA